MKAQRGSTGIALLFVYPRRYMGVGGQRQAPATLPPEKTRYPLHRTLGGPRAGLDGCGKSRPHWDSIPAMSSPRRVAIPTELSRPTNHISLQHKKSQKLSTDCLKLLSCQFVWGWWNEYIFSLKPKHNARVHKNDQALIWRWLLKNEIKWKRVCTIVMYRGTHFPIAS